MHRILREEKARIRASGTRAETLGLRRVFNQKLRMVQGGASDPIAEFNTTFQSTVPYIVALFPDAVEIKYGDKRTVWASNLADAPPGMPPFEVSIPGSPVFGSSEALFQWMKGRFFDERLHLARYGDDAYPEAKGRSILRSTFTPDLSGAQAKSRAGQGRSPARSAVH